MTRKTVGTFMLAGALFAAGQLIDSGNVQAGAEVDLRTLLSERSRNLDTLLGSNDSDFLREGNRNGNGSVLERIKSRCASLKKKNNWNVSCDWQDLKLR